MALEVDRRNLAEDGAAVEAMPAFHLQPMAVAEATAAPRETSPSSWTGHCSRRPAWRTSRPRWPGSILLAPQDRRWEEDGR